MRIVTSTQNVKAVAPLVLEQVLIETEPPAGQSKVGAPWVRGIEPSLETNISILPSSIIAGQFDVADRGLLVGSEFAHNLDVSVGDRVMVYSPSDLRKWRESATNESARVPSPPEFEVRGIFDVGYFDYNFSFSPSSLATTQ